MESNTSEAASSSGNLASCSTDMYQSHQLQSSQQSQNSPVVQDFKMPSSLGEVQRIIGLSLSKIQMGRNQRGGLPLHKNLLVATVLNKARDLYMQETMYMNYKMMTGQFAAAASAASSSSNGNSQMHEAMHHHSQHYHHHYGMVNGCNNHVNTETDDDMEPNVEAHEADYDEDSESDVEDECDVTSVPSVASSSHNQLSTYPSSAGLLLCNLPSSMAAPNAANDLSAPSQPLPNSNMANGQGPAAPDAASSIGLLGHHHPAGIGINANELTPSASDEGFIDEPDCDCDARNFSTSESRVPFQYCYHCAPFHPSSGRGPTLVPSPPSPTPNSSSAPSAAASCPSCPSSSSAGQPENSLSLGAAAASADHPVNAAAVIYDMDSQTTKDSSKERSNLRGTKRRRNSSEDETDEFSQAESGKKRRESTENIDNLNETLNSSQDESGYQSPSDSSLNEVFHPAFRGSPSCTPSSTPDPSNATVVQTDSPVANGGGNGQNTMEIDQITSLVSIFSFGQHIMAAAAAKAATQKREFQEEEEEDEVSNKTSSSKKPAGNKKSESSEDSDSESDTSSDSGHSSDDHEATAKEEDSNTDEAASSSVTVTKLTRSVSTPDLCAVTSQVSTTSMASEAPPCVEVASL